MSRPLASRKPGVSLIELLVVAAMTSVVIGVMSNILLDSWKGQLVQEALNQAQQKARFTVTEIADVARQSSGVVDSVTYEDETYYSNSSSVILKLVADGQTPGDVDYIVFRVRPTDNSVVERLVLPALGSSRSSWKTPLAINLDNSLFQIRYFETSIVENELIAEDNESVSPATRIQVRSQITKEVYGRTVIREFEQRAALRNKP